jgi:hypothetical protein
MDKLIDELCYLNHLLYLKVYRCNFRSSHIDSIWHLTKLTHFNVTYIEDIDWSAVPTVQSLSLRNVFIHPNRHFRLLLRRLSEYSPSLRHLSTDSIDDHYYEPGAFFISTIEILNLQFEGTTDRLTNILRTVPNLSKLTIEIEGTYVNGHQWQNIITDSLPKLKIFQFLMKFPADRGINSDYAFEVSSLLDSYRTPFWIKKHQWFVGCHNLVGQCRSASFCLYTLPFAFGTFSLDFVSQLQSTCPDDGDYYWYGRVRSLTAMSDLSTNVPLIYFTNIHHLSVKLPTTDRW